jgi:hypothetical protein
MLSGSNLTVTSLLQPKWFYSILPTTAPGAIAFLFQQLQCRSLRFADRATAGSFSGKIVHSSPGAADVNLAASGTVSDPVPTINVGATLLPQYHYRQPHLPAQFTTSMALS